MKKTGFFLPPGHHRREAGPEAAPEMANGQWQRRPQWKSKNHPWAIVV
jgi:hypothetical protein